MSSANWPTWLRLLATLVIVAASIGYAVWSMEGLL